MGGVVTLSIEIELAWGRHHLTEPNRFANLSQDRTIETNSLARLLDLFKQCDIQATFDIVGHLLHEQCDGAHRSPHEPS